MMWSVMYVGEGRGQYDCVSVIITMMWSVMYVGEGWGVNMTVSVSL